MTFADSLDPASILVDVETEFLDEVLDALLDTPALAFGDPAQRRKWARELAFGERGEIVRIHPEVVLVLMLEEGLAAPISGLAVSNTPFEVPGEDGDEAGRARAVMLFLLPGRLSAFRGQAAPVLSRWMREGDHAARLLAATTPAEVAALPGLGALVLTDRLRVDAISSPVPHRVHPETPVTEVVQLLVDHSIHAVPVVGDADELLGVITVGDALRHLLPGRRTDGEEGQGLDTGDRTARDVMTRSVLCVAEDQSLADAAQMMVNRNVDELPVVREGVLVGMLTKNAILRALHEG